MNAATRARAKAKRDLALNLTELSHVTGWNRNLLAAMQLPLSEKKIRKSDFDHVMRRRLDAVEDLRARLFVVHSADGEITEHKVPAGFEVMPRVMPDASQPVGARSVQEVADKFDEPSPKHASTGA